MRKKKSIFKEKSDLVFLWLFFFQNVSDSLPPLPSPVNKDLPPPPLPSPVNKDLPPPPPPLSVMPAHNRDLRPLPTSPAKPQNLSPRGKDGYTKVSIILSYYVPQTCIFWSFEMKKSEEFYYFCLSWKESNWNKNKNLSVIFVNFS